MLQPVPVALKHLSDYASIVGRGLVEDIRERAERLKGKRVLHVSATAFGGGVSEILYTLIPLMIDVGLECEWHVIYGREEFFNATKVMHNALQGNPQDLSEQQWETWRQYNEINARDLSADWDVIIIHDPQPAGLASLASDKARHWVWRCHIDLSTPNRVSHAPVRPRRTAGPSPHRAAGDRSPGAEEHGLLNRRRHLYLPTVRDRRRSPAVVSGLAL